MSTRQEQLAALGSHIARRRDAILEAWRRKVSADPRLTTGTSLPRAQLHDHIPALLEDFEHRLTAATSATRAAAEDTQKGDAAAHGLHRWQQGFDLNEVTRELGRLNECVVVELDACAASQPSFDAATMAEARSVWAGLYSISMSSSTSQYFKLRQIEAAGHVADLEQALESLRELEAQRAELWQQAAHDLRGNVGVVALATAGLTSGKASADARTKFLNSLDRNVRALHRLLEDVTGLARLQGGQEVRALAPMDASRLLRELADGLQALADERGLSLGFDGPQTFPVEGDAVKTRRIVQNLVINAIKYTARGGVVVAWGDADANDSARWFIQITDTGPGLRLGPGAPLAGALEAATDQAKDVVADEISGEVTHSTPAQSALPAPAAGAGTGTGTGTSAVYQQPGEGIGLSIVKRLCELLDATMEVDSRPGAGTSFRLLFPKRYEG